MGSSLKGIITGGGQAGLVYKPPERSLLLSSSLYKLLRDALSLSFSLSLSVYLSLSLSLVCVINSSLNDKANTHGKQTKSNNEV